MWRTFTATALTGLLLLTSCSDTKGSGRGRVPTPVGTKASGEIPFVPPKVLPLTTHIPLGGLAAHALTATHKSIWVLTTRSGPSKKCVSTASRCAKIVLWRVAPGDNRTERHPIPLVAGSYTAMVAWSDHLWIITSRPIGPLVQGRSILVDYDISRDQIVSRRTLPAAPLAMTIRGSHLWIAVGNSSASPTTEGRLLDFDVRARRVVHTLPSLTSPQSTDTLSTPIGLLSGPTALWLDNRYTGQLLRIDPDTYDVRNVKDWPQYVSLAAITKTSMWTTDGAVEQRDPLTARMVTHSGDHLCFHVIVSGGRAWVVCDRRVEPTIDEEPEHMAPLLFAYNISQRGLIGPPIPVGRPFDEVVATMSRFGSAWALSGVGLVKVDSAALTCQVTPRCASTREIRYPQP